MSTIKEGTRVKGIYFGAGFEGVVESIKYAAIGAILLYVLLDTPITLPSMKRNKKFNTFEKIIIDQNLVTVLEYEESRLEKIC